MMRRFRFYVPGDDGRPIQFPPEGPFWITGYAGDEEDVRTYVVAYSPDEETLTGPARWPDAQEIDDMGDHEIEFTDRFRCPEWWSAMLAEREKGGAE